MFTFLIVAIILSYLTYIFISSYKSYYFNNLKDIILFVTAHPDDECMFFAPTILNLRKQGYTIYLLCLSSGGFYNQSFIRKEELRESCKILGIPSENVIVIEHSTLPDNPKLDWNRRRVALLIRKYFNQLSAKMIFSFDQYGVSGHLNHIAIHNGLKYLKANEMLPRDCQVFELKSIFLLQKYLTFLSVPLGLLCHPSMYFVSSFSDIQKIWLSMKAHRSQFVWFRKLYILFSRYVYINTFEELVVDDKMY